jgi:hypothetical protein
LRGREARKWGRLSRDGISHERAQSRRGGVEKIKVFHDAVGHTLTIWIDDPAKEEVCTETTDEVVIMKDKSNRVIGFEVLNYMPAKSSQTIGGRAASSKVRVKRARVKKIA